MRRFHPRSFLSFRACGLTAVVIAWAGVAPALAEKGGAVGRCDSPAGSLLELDGKDWRVVPKPGEIVAGKPVMALPGQSADIDMKSGAVRVGLRGNLPELSRFPVLESVVTLHEAARLDLDLTLDRGRVDLTNLKRQAPANIRVRFRNEKWDLALAPGARAAVELYARWPAGMHHRKGKDRPAEDVPTVEVVLLVFKGRAELKADVHTYELRSPPGPSRFHWDSVLGQDRGPGHLDETPAWAGNTPLDTPECKALHAALESQRKALADQPLKEVLAAELSSDDPAAREIAVYGLAATDDLPGLVGALAREKDADVRERSVEAVRHWIGRGVAQETALYDLLVGERKYSPAHAEIVLHLLHGFDRAARERPETYEVLIAYLRHDKLAIRGLAHWHLDRLVPAGRTIKYDPAGSEEGREQAYQEWKKLVPEGKLPPRERAKEGTPK